MISIPNAGQRVCGIIALLLLLGVCVRQARSQTPATDFPSDSTRGEFIILPIFDAISALNPKGFTEADLQVEMTKLKAQVGENRGAFRVGFSHIVGSSDALLAHCKLAKANNLSVGVIIGTQTHSGFARPLVTQDFRRMQWRMDGTTWEGEEKVNVAGNPEYPSRDWRVATPSRYCAALHNLAMSETRSRAASIVKAMRAYPGTIAVVNATIEEELATSGEARDGLLADYSPYAVTEFRDWLRHTGMYDDQNGAYRGEGAPEEIVGPFQKIKGRKRSPFYDDPNPNDAGKSGVSFNQWFGTNFTTWTLRSWDLDQFPAPITDRTFKPTPAIGAPGATEGGFDAPRTRAPADRYWKAWSWDVYDQAGAYPPGNPLHPAFGFRQVEIAHFVTDVLNEAQRAGIPKGLLYAHQIPSEQVSPTRNRSGADPIWTGLYAPAHTLGITRFGPIDPARLAQYSRDWGIFEWHPAPGAKPDAPALYKATIDALNAYAKAGGHIFFAGWWRKDGALDATFPLNDSQFAKALHDWIEAHSQTGTRTSSHE